MKKQAILLLTILTVAGAGCNLPQYNTVPAYNFPSSNQNYQDNYELKQVSAIMATASALSRQKRFDEAIEKYQEGINFVFSHPELKESLRQGLYATYLEQALYLGKQGQFRKAISAMRLAIENCYECSKEDYSRWYVNLAIFLDKADRTDEAIEAVRTAISFDPDKVDSHILLAQILDAVGRQTEAMQVLEKAVKVDPENAMVYYRLGSLYLGQGEYSKAIQLLNKSIEIEPNNIYANLSLSLAYERAGMQKEYKQFLQRAAEIDPNKAMKLQEVIEQNPINSDQRKTQVQE